MYKSKYANLMQHLMNEHDLILLDSEQQEIEKWLEKDLKAINYSQCFYKLNDEILQPFKDFVNANYWEQDNEYICKETNKKEDLDDIVRYWHQEY